MAQQPEVVNGDHHQSLVSFVSAAQAGCYICEFARQALIRCDERDNCRVEHFGFRYFGGRSGPLLILFCIESLYEEKTERRKTGVLFHAWPIPRLNVTGSENVRKRKGCIPEAEAVRKIREWMGICLRDHEGSRCWKKDTKPGSYPLRLLELAPSSFRVLRTAVDRPQGPYVTLSYCWGPNPAFLRLTAWNEKELEAGVPTSRLPLAFREAISVIQGLALRYVWIDSLCIVQDGPGSSEEWETESARMDQTYADSVLTLALSCAESPEESILNQACTLKTASPPFEFKPDSEHSDAVHNGFAIVPYDYFAHGLYEQPLWSRAWALQEHVMATRVVSFGLGELFWDCAQLPNASESVPGGRQGTHTATSMLRLTEKTIPDGSSDPALSNTWSILLREYTRRSLTFPEKDKLAALSAIARDIGKAMEDVYVAGHFWKTLPESLLWFSLQDELVQLRTDGPRLRGRRLFWSEEPGAEEVGPRPPSWSWASFDGPVLQHVIWWRPQPQLAEAVSYKLELANQANPTGPCNFASLSIRDYCTEVEWLSRNEPAMVARTRAWTHGNTIFKLDLDEPGVIRTTGTKSLMMAIIEDESAEQWKGLVVERIHHNSESRIRCRRIGHFAISGYPSGSLIWWQERFSIFGEKKRLFELV